MPDPSHISAPLTPADPTLSTGPALDSGDDAAAPEDLPAMVATQSAEGNCAPVGPAEPDSPAFAVCPPPPAALGDRQVCLTQDAGDYLGYQMRGQVATLYNATADAGAQAAALAVLADIQSGAVPQPADDPAAVETALVRRIAEVFNRRSASQPFPTTWTVLQYARTGPTLPMFARVWRTSMTPFVSVRAARIAGTEPNATTGATLSESMAVARPPVTAVLRLADSPVSISACGLEPVVDWKAFAAAVYRDDLLLRIARDRQIADALELSEVGLDSPYHLPCRVAAPPPPPPPAALPAPRRRRRSR